MFTTRIVADDGPSGYPFGYSRHAYAAELRHLPTAELIAQVEDSRWLALEHADDEDGTRSYLEMQLDAMLLELERRQRLLKARPTDPLRPPWPTDTDANRRRIEAVKAAWSMESFCRDVLLMELTPTTNGKLRGRCPMFGHPDKTPSFYVYPDNRAHCHGCHRGGDVLKIAQYVLNTGFLEALRLLEQETR